MADDMCQRIAHAQECRNVSGYPQMCAPGCVPAPCRAEGDHPGTDHLDPRSPHYDGPILPQYKEGEAWRVILKDLPDTVETRVAVHALIESARRDRDSAAHARVDRDRGIGYAMTRALDCDEHGERIADLETRLAAMGEAGRRNEKARLALLGFLHAVDDLVEAHRDGRLNLDLSGTMDGLIKISKRVHAAHKRAWS